MEFDLWIPEYEICFEFQDAYHYMTTWYYQNPQEHIKHKDHIKKNMALQNGMTLIIIPCWWDSTVETLVATIDFHRPDLMISGCGQLIDLNPPNDYFTERDVPEIGELMSPSFPPTTFGEISARAWWLGEKYDGVRCCWTPTNHIAYSRYGRSLQILHKFDTLIPDLFIDSELWFGRGQFLDTFALVKGTENLHWPMLRLITFDIPSSDFQRVPFEGRYTHLVDSISQNHAFLIIPSRILSSQMLDWFDLSWFVQCIIQNGGEGVILQQTGSFYHPGRHVNLLKLKTAKGDQEAIVVGVTSGNGLVKSVLLKLPNGLTFTVPQENIHISCPKVGVILRHLIYLPFFLLYMIR
eukprot:Phypoly_transcript_06589.p1 GENE.Phypoly_transcript_06589~~Phypoly_transcript_06589.p1  ORF type:complete len:413 (+),score=20.94 Phypoly_transcript_06589:184-1239(+)